MQRKEEELNCSLEVGSLAASPGIEAVCDLTVFLGALLTPDCSFSSHSSALPFIEMLSKEAAGLMSQDLYALLRRREREENLLNSLTKFLPWRFDLVLTY